VYVCRSTHRRFDAIIDRVDARALEPLRRIPSIDRLLADEQAASLLARFSRTRVVEALREAAEAWREAVRCGNSREWLHDGEAELWRRAEWRLRAQEEPSLQPAINATGVVLHTGLGRAVLPRAAVAAMGAVGSAHSLLEIERDSGERGSRQEHVRGLLCRLTGAEDALAVNNNAAAVLLAIAALAAGREVVIARGQLVEIGGSFRIPDVIRQSGARLVEVGSTNKVRLSDYAAAITDETALLLRVHSSNFQIVGFTEEVPLPALAQLGRERGIPVMDDLGSGALVDMTRYGLEAEPTVPESVAAGADVITFSGDKLLGGPQAGLILGRQDCLDRMKRHPLMRVVRNDKVTLAGLEATLRLYLDEGRATREIPTLRALTATPAALRAKAARLRRAIGPVAAAVALEPGISQVGGGSLPGERLPTTLVTLAPEAIDEAELSRRLRLGEPAVFGRLQRGRLLLDPRTVSDEELPRLAAAVREALGARR
jgi:L-seryl-tRNA(Ser) seleniumtransferase